MGYRTEYIETNGKDIYGMGGKELKRKGCGYFQDNIRRINQNELP